jgi:hypothetical protein
MSETEAPRRTITVAGVVAVLASLGCLLLMGLLVVVAVTAVNHQRMAREAMIRAEMAEVLAAKAQQSAMAEAQKLTQELKAEKILRVQAELRAEQAERALKELRLAKE